jgi:hypothetical protein
LRSFVDVLQRMLARSRFVDIRRKYPKRVGSGNNLAPGLSNHVKLGQNLGLIPNYGPSTLVTLIFLERIRNNFVHIIETLPPVGSPQGHPNQGDVHLSHLEAQKRPRFYLAKYTA